ncbi:MAG: hypothetical protein ACW99E_19245 [Promethearchaeota archaeon]|jgi:hypothetical protein
MVAEIKNKRQDWKIGVMLFVISILLSVFSLVLGRYTRYFMIAAIVPVLIGTSWILVRWKRKNIWDFLVMYGIVAFVSGFLIEMVAISFELYFFIVLGLPIVLMVLGIFLILIGGLRD